MTHRAYSPEDKGFIKNGVKIFAMDLGLEFLLSVRQQINFDVWVAASTDILDWKVLRL